MTGFYKFLKQSHMKCHSLSLNPDLKIGNQEIYYKQEKKIRCKTTGTESTFLSKPNGCLWVLANTCPNKTTSSVLLHLFSEGNHTNIFYGKL